MTGNNQKGSDYRVKKKFLSIFIALVLVLSFSLATAVPVAANGPSEVWVDDDFTGATPGWGITHFDKIQDGIDAVDPGGTVNVLAGDYAGAIVDKDVNIIGATDEPSVITSGVPYKSGSGLQTAFRLGADADGAEIRNFTMNGDYANKFWFGVFARSADSVIVDSLTLDNMVQGISNWGGSGWEITSNVITETYPTYGGGIAIYLGGDPTDFPHCDNNVVQGNTISTSAEHSGGFTGAAICLWFDERNDGGYVPPTDQSMTGNEIKDNSITASGLENQVGVEIGVGGLDGDPVKVAACLGVIHDNTVTNNTIDNAEWGLNLYVTTDLTVSGNTIKNCSDCGIYMKDDNINCLINNNNIYGNTNYGLNNTDGATYSTTVNATNNWWGHASGPSGEYGRVNPARKVVGKGDAVSDNVDWDPWLRMLVWTNPAGKDLPPSRR